MTKQAVFVERGDMMDDFAYLILAIVSEIPEGKVASYSQIAAIAGYPKNARKVGKVLANATMYGTYPCHRVIHHDGTLVMGFEEQASLLAAEGVAISHFGKVNMSVFRWKEAS